MTYNVINHYSDSIYHIEVNQWQKIIPSIPSEQRHGFY